MTNETADLFIEHEEQMMKDIKFMEEEQFWAKVNELAEKYEVTNDYILWEFI